MLPAKLSLLQAFRTRHAKANQHRRSRKTAHHSAAFLCSRKAQQTALRLSIKAAWQVKHAASQALTVASFQNPPCKSKSAPQVQKNGTPLCRLPLQPQSTTNRSKAQYQGGMASETCCQPSSHCCKLSEPAMQKQISTAGPEKRHTTLPPSFAAAKHNKPL